MRASREVCGDRWLGPFSSSPLALLGLNGGVHAAGQPAGWGLLALARHSAHLHPSGLGRVTTQAGRAGAMTDVRSTGARSQKLSRLDSIFRPFSAPNREVAVHFMGVPVGVGVVWSKHFWFYTNASYLLGAEGNVKREIRFLSPTPASSLSSLGLPAPWALLAPHPPHSRGKAEKQCESF